MTAQNDRRLNHEYMHQPGRLRRPGRGLKTIEINQLTIQKTASHTEILTLPYGIARRGRTAREKLFDDDLLVFTTNDNL